MKIKQIFTKLITAGLASATLWITGCASIITSGDCTIPVTSNPDAATVTVYDMDKNVVFNGPTPTKIKLKKGAGYFKGADYRLVIVKTGYQPTEIKIRHNMNGWYVGNFIIGGFLGLLVVDPLTGGMWVLKPGKVDVQLAPSATGLNESELPIMTIAQLTQAQREQLEPLNSIH